VRGSPSRAPSRSARRRQQLGRDVALLPPGEDDPLLAGAGLVVDGDQADQAVEVRLRPDPLRQLVAGVVAEVEGDGERSRLRPALLGQDVDLGDEAAVDVALRLLRGDRQADRRLRPVVVAPGEDDQGEQDGEDGEPGREHQVDGERPPAEAPPGTTLARGRQGGGGSGWLVGSLVLVGHRQSAPLSPMAESDAGPGQTGRSRFVQGV
jgi:hypothetical protein